MDFKETIDNLKKILLQENDKHKQILFKTIIDISKKKPMDYPNPNYKNIFIVKKSELNVCWGVEFQSWVISSEILLKKFQDKTIFECIDYLNNLYLQKTNNNTISIKIGKNNISIDSLFIEKILSQLGYIE
jgi:hypothetical protein